MRGTGYKFRNNNNNKIGDNPKGEVLYTQEIMRKEKMNVGTSQVRANPTLRERHPLQLSGVLIRNMATLRAEPRHLASKDEETSPLIFPMSISQEPRRRENH